MNNRVERIETDHIMEMAFKIRQEVFVLEQGVPASEEYDEYDKIAHHYIIYHKDVPAGTARWRPTEKGIKLERFAILEPFRNNGMGFMLLEKMLQDIPSPSYLYLHAQLPAVNLYKRAGFTTVGNTFMECDIEHYKMELLSN